MKQRIRILIAFVMLLGVTSAIVPVSAAPSPVTTYSLSNITCSSVVVSGHTTHSGTIAAFIKDKTTNIQIGSTIFSIDNSGNFSGILSFPPAVGDSLRVHVVFNGGDESFTDPACAPAVTFCNLSGDGRLNGLCGDRIAVYCNSTGTPANLDVFVIDNQGGGHELTKLPLADLKAVPSGKYDKSLGADGTVFAGWSGGVYYIALQGGPYGGTATGDWLKANLTCGS